MPFIKLFSLCKYYSDVIQEFISYDANAIILAVYT